LADLDFFNKLILAQSQTRADVVVIDRRRFADHEKRKTEEFKGQAQTPQPRRYSLVGTSRTHPWRVNKKIKRTSTPSAKSSRAKNCFRPNSSTARVGTTMSARTLERALSW
jgi:hypothetical protein